MEEPKTPIRYHEPQDEPPSLKRAIIELLKVKTIVTLAIIGVMSYLAVQGSIATDTFMAVAGSVVTYYFTRNEHK